MALTPLILIAAVGVVVLFGAVLLLCSGGGRQKPRDNGAEEDRDWPEPRDD